MSSHYFIGIKIPSEFGVVADNFIEQYQLRHHYKVIPHHEDLHITLLFLGSVEMKHHSIVKDELTKIATNTSSFHLKVNGLSYFGSNKGPRVVYLSINECDALNRLQQQINTSIPQLLSMPPTDRFIPHVTIAKKRKTKEAINIVKQTIEEKDVLVSAISLFTIHPAQSPKYEAVATFHLGAEEL